MSKGQTIKFSINVQKIDKERLFTGKKGLYCGMVLIPTPDNQYGNDFMIVQETTKEEREKGIRGEILGNGKYWKDESGLRPKERNFDEQQKAESQGATQEESDSTPF